VVEAIRQPSGRLQSHSIQKLVAALRVLRDEVSYERADEYCRLSL